MQNKILTVMAISLAASTVFAEDTAQWVPEFEQCVLDHFEDEPAQACIKTHIQFCIEHAEGWDTGEVASGYIEECVLGERNVWDALLNKYYKKALNRIKDYQPNGQSYAGENPQESFKQAQRDWLTFRDSECIAHTLFNYGGSFSKTEYGICLNRLTAERAIFFMTWNCNGLTEEGCIPWIE